jgi:hypothetical protein
MKFSQLSWKKEWTTPALFVAGIILGISVAGATAFVLQKSPSDSASKPPVQVDGVESYPDDTGPDLNTAAALTVDWGNVKRLTPSDLHEVFDGPAGGAANVSAALKQTGLDGSVTEFAVGQSSGVWMAGTVRTDDDWKGATVYLMRYSEGMGFSNYTLVRPMNTSTVYAVGAVRPAADSYEYQANPLLNYLAYLPNASIAELEMPETLTTTNGVTLYKSSRYWIQPFRFELTESLRQITNTTDGRTVYQRESDQRMQLGTTPDGSQAYIDNGCFSVFAPNGLEYVYTTHIPIKEKITDNGTMQVPNITWLPGFEHEGDYIYMRTGGCGSVGCLNVISQSEVDAVGTLRVVGKTNEGENLYAAHDEANDPRVKVAYDSWYDPAWSSYTYGQEGVKSPDKPSIEAFLKKYPVPIFYWKDGFGRWVVHMTSVAQPPVECGKPVIYLYPEQTTDVSVRLPSFINVTVSDPAYPTNGWNVTAQPNGTLTDKSDGKTYGSLYWEGTGVGYVTPTDGWVVKDGDVENFLSTTLPKYGLNAQETKDFMEFWVPEMKGAPYYRVSFLTSAWNEAAPLFVSPRPQSVIRIFMDWKPLMAPITIQAPKIEMPARDGFTLVEWGGTLWK